MLRSGLSGLFLLGVGVLAGCSMGLEPDPVCVATVNVHGVLYGTPSVAAPDSSTVSASPYLFVTRGTGCLDQGQPGGSLEHGESNFLATGTPIHTIDGFAPSERLAFWSAVIEEWIVLSPAPNTVPG
jgi:hypothetical protein